MKPKRRCLSRQKGIFSHLNSKSPKFHLCDVMTVTVAVVFSTEVRSKAFRMTPKYFPISILGLLEEGDLVTHLAVIDGRRVAPWYDVSGTAVLK